MKRILLIILLCAFKVHDGDTFTMDNGTVVRLWGVDAPEMKNPRAHCEEQLCLDEYGNFYRCANEATQYLIKLLSNKHITCVSRGTSYNRMIGDCYADNVRVSATMIHSGWAVEDRRFSMGRFTEIETVARLMHYGIWQGRFEMPWDYRKTCSK